MYIHKCIYTSTEGDNIVGILGTKGDNILVVLGTLKRYVYIYKYLYTSIKGDNIVGILGTREGVGLGILVELHRAFLIHDINGAHEPEHHVVLLSLCHERRLFVVERCLLTTACMCV